MEVEQENTPPSTLPDTQNVDSQSTQSQNTLTPFDNEPEVWGRLFPSEGLPVMQLTKDEYILGRRPDCDICVGGKVAQKVELAISKVHFKIYRDKVVTSNGFEDDVVYLIDLSQNGTFVNNNLIGKGNKVILVNNDSIAVARANIIVYVYLSTNGYDDSILPDEFKNKYMVSKTIGAGACGEVKLCYSKTTGKKYAMKIITKSNYKSASEPKNPVSDKKNILNEVEICMRLKHPCIIKVEEYYDTPSKLFIILELMEGGELFERIKKYNGLSEKHAKFIFYQVILAVNYLHTNGITHRDLKPQNILLAGHEQETVVKVSDFGLSKIVHSQTMMKTFCGTRMYAAPEILSTNGKEAYNSQVDVWSLGVILYCCLTGLTPFKNHDKTHLLDNQIVRGMYNCNLPQFKNITTCAQDLIRKMMTVDPKKRITIRETLRHPWFNDKEMVTKVNNLLGIKSNENTVLRRPNSDNILSNLQKFKKARLE